MLEEKKVYWRPIKGFETYRVSSEGEVENFSKQKLLKPRTTKAGYKTVSLHHKGKRRDVCVHRLVAEEFIERHSGYITHINGDRSDNRYENIIFKKDEMPEEPKKKRKIVKRSVIKPIFSVKGTDVYRRHKLVAEFENKTLAKAYCEQENVHYVNTRICLRKAKDEYKACRMAARLDGLQRL